MVETLAKQKRGGRENSWLKGKEEELRLHFAYIEVMYKCPMPWSIAPPGSHCLEPSNVQDCAESDI